METIRVLIVDDQRSARRVLQSLVEGVPGVEAHEAASLEAARAHLAVGSFELVFIDVRLTDDPTDRSGLLLLRELRDQTSSMAVIVTASAEMHVARQAMRLGAYDYLLKEELCAEAVGRIVESVRAKLQLEKEVIRLRARVAADTDPSGIVGVSRAVQKLREAIRRVSVSTRPVLVWGPTGSGKELVVRTLHAMGPNPEEPLLDVNCGALPEPLIESQLFGHVKGAFTGADQRQRGYMSAVGKGTLFLDEIAELGIALQAKLLRVLETGTFRPVGSTNDERFEGRVVSATHANLEARVADGRFREDLYYRLNVLLVRVPSLDERKEDIPILASHFLSQQPRPLHLEADGMEYLMARSWPGNVRELRNVIDRLAVFAESEVIGADDIRALEGGADKRGEDSTLRLVVRAFLRSQHPNKLLAAETALIQEALLLADGNKSLAARLLGTHRKYLERRVAKPDAEPGDAEAVDAGE